MLSLRALRSGLPFGPLAALVAACLLTSTVAFAAPAVVTSDSCDAHTAPFKSTPVVARFRSGDKLSAEEHARDGWRRVRLADGTTAFVRDDELKLESEIPPPPKPAPPPFTTVPAKVKVFELAARSAPATAAPVLETYAENQSLAVSEAEKDGWRRVVLADGRIAFVASTGLTVGAAQAAGATSVPPATVTTAAAATSPTVQPLSSPKPPEATLYVKDLGHLAELVRQDDVVYPMADNLATRRNAGLGIMIGGGAVGGLLAILGFTALSKQSCTDSGYCSDEPNEGVAITGLAIMCVAPLIGLLVLPRRNDLLDVINAWNSRHVDNQFKISSGEVGSGL